jgi:hypothetical protein
MREFLTYTVIGLRKDVAEIHRKAQELYDRVKLISKKKYELAYNTVSKVIEPWKTLIISKRMFAL